MLHCILLAFILDVLGAAINWKLAQLSVSTEAQAHGKQLHR